MEATPSPPSGFFTDSTQGFGLLHFFATYREWIGKTHARSVHSAMRLAKNVLLLSGALAGVVLLVTGGTCAISILRMGSDDGEAGDLRQAAEALRAYRESESHFPAEMPPGPDYLMHWTDMSRHGYPRYYATDGQRFVLASPGANGSSRGQGSSSCHLSRVKNTPSTTTPLEATW